MKRCLVLLLSCCVLAAPAQAAPTLERGDRGRAVKVLQERLGVPADGVFGRQTTRALKRFQRTNGLRVTGRADRRTRLALGLEQPVRPAPPVGDGGVTAGEALSTDAIVAAARSVLGAEYEAAAAGPDSFDCSGLVVWAAAQAGFELPRSSFQQFEVGAPVALEDIAAGDLVFFDTAGPGPSDVGIATGPDMVISATTHGVREHTLAGPYWGKHFVGARRL